MYLLDNNRLASLPAGLFDALTGLTILNLDRNRLQTLPEDLFEKLTALHCTCYSYGNPGTTTFVPTALAGDDQTVGPGATVTLDGERQRRRLGLERHLRLDTAQRHDRDPDRCGHGRAELYRARLDRTDMTYELTVTGVSCT